MTKPNYRYCYKVVRLCTATHRLTGLHHHDVIYQAGEWTEPPEGCGPLCVFDTLRNAWKFVDGQLLCGEYPDVAIYTCLIEPSQDNKVWHKSKTWHTGGELTLSLSFLPHGTVLASKVQLLAGGMKAYRGDDFCLRDAICGCEQIQAA